MTKEFKVGQKLYRVYDESHLAEKVSLSIKEVTITKITNKFIVIKNLDDASTSLAFNCRTRFNKTDRNICTTKKQATEYYKQILVNWIESDKEEILENQRKLKFLETL